jgi:RNA polymerase sigma-70 factor (TIGR02960 family)
MAAMATDRTVTAAPGPEVLESRLEPYRVELTAYAYRMLGSSFEAEDAVQETLLRAWRGYQGFEGRSGLRSWLYRIATNVCLDMLRGRSRRAMPMDLGPAATAEVSLGQPLPDAAWVEPIPDDRVLPDGGDPAVLTEARETIRLAFMAALQRLPPRQRAVLILREVLRWKAAEVAELLDTSVASVNSALQRARATLRERLPEHPSEWSAGRPSEQERALLARFIDAHERADAAAAAELVREDIRITMPPYPWLYDGLAAIQPLLHEGLTDPGDWRLVPTWANRQPAAASYLRARGETEFRAFKLDVLRVEAGRIAEITTFGPALFPAFGLPATLEAGAR